ncbi:uncharacterized protein BJ212DRAFT_1326445 [Suillus subaureus]|uniref:Uncharacterized protein n=1 Tax=Suillus subaureus TaxID=48587 RepID=A0A9P7AN90_9AGAM|nr:uncharacterized protein BJ212DRAFT_1416824 [Suillus subaureus]XP_041197817.1 uncharacterized protein BJ212DRAFT_1326445 [Suillus subaureus]KAG1792719.1 hypothetical protein BJ212DRAFT_1416824 [Suillus subaureus]KAG1823757.1 hypothetical protein BJ212DRAFT_1326445 [Suillus subaureus]
MHQHQRPSTSKTKIPNRDLHEDQNVNVNHHRSATLQRDEPLHAHSPTRGEHSKFDTL